jgi:nicotinate-nucleotide pyrophosphorylase
MSDNQPAAQPNANDVLASLASAADAARQVYLVALAANPGADLSQLYVAEMKALALWSDAQDKALNNDNAIAAAQSNLDAATQAIRTALSTIKDISTWATLANNLVQLATTVAKFFP